MELNGFAIYRWFADNLPFANNLYDFVENSESRHNHSEAKVILWRVVCICIWISVVFWFVLYWEGMCAICVFICVDFVRDFDSCQAKVGMLDCWKKENTLNIDLSESESWCEFQTVKACQPNSRLQQIHSSTLTHPPPLQTLFSLIWQIFTLSKGSLCQY